MLRQLLTVILALWAGSLWTVCAIVAHLLFSVVPDRSLAGDLAGHFFRVESWLGLALGGVVLALLSRIDKIRSNANYALAIVTSVAPLSNEIVLRPIMESARAAGDMRLFGILHGGAALLFGFACVTVLGLIWRTSRETRVSPAE
jgi:hypothetical protein